MNRSDDTFQIEVYIAVPEPQNAPATRLQEASPCRIGFGVIGMLSSVDFNRDTQRAARQIKGEALERQLTRKARAKAT